MPVMNQMLPPATDPPATAGAVTVVTGKQYKLSS